MVRWLSKNRDKDFLRVLTSASTGKRVSSTAAASEYTLSSKIT